jgi:hypothetical protein
LSASSGRTGPSAASVSQITAAHGVRWLFADLTTADAVGLASASTLEFRQGDCAVYRVAGP